MRMNFLFSGTFWGVVLILLGISAILRTFNINIPFGRFFFGLFIIYLGLIILTGGNIFKHSQQNIIFNELDIKITDTINDEYNIIFGSGVIDLTEISPEKAKSVEINTIFGSSEILINPNIPVIIKASSVFGKVSLPNGNSISFGDYKYTSDNKDSEPIIVEVNVVFGSTEVKNVNNKD